jgi:hypothetical protein
VRKGFIGICSVLAIAIMLLAVLVPGCTPTTGTIEVKATLDGAPWPPSAVGAVTYTLTGPAGTAAINGTEVPKTYTVGAGTWTCAYVAGGPGIFVNITPSASQSVAAGETKTFTLNFRTPATPDAWVTFKSWTINGVEVDPLQQQGPFVVGWGAIIDCEYTEHVEGEQGDVVTVHQTSWLEVHNNGMEGEPGPSIWLHAVNDPGAVTMDPPAEGKANQTCTVEGNPVPYCTEVELPFCEWVTLDVEVDWDLVICTEYEKTINWIGFPVQGPLAGLPILFDFPLPLPGQTLELISWACVSVEGDENPDNNCSANSSKLTVMFMPPV